MNTREAAQRLGLSVWAVRALVDAAQLGALRIGRKPLYKFSEDHISEYLRRSEVRPMAA